MRVCAEPGCPKFTDSTRCADHRLKRDAARGRRQARGYGAEHVAQRARLQSYMDAGVEYWCWRCGAAIDAANWCLGHCDDDRSIYHGPECGGCNYATSGRSSERCPHAMHISPDA